MNKEYQQKEAKRFDLRQCRRWWDEAHERALKHNDRIHTQVMIRLQLEENAAKYKAQALKERIPESLLAQNTSTAINKKGTTMQQEEAIPAC